MINYFYAFISSLVAMTVIDALWLGMVAPRFYKQHIGFLLADKPNWLAAAAYYVIFVIGITVFVVYPGWQNAESLVKIGILGALFGLVAYATYDLTNLATIKGWPPIVTIVDLAWGAFLSSTVSVLAVSLLKALIK